MNDWSLREDIFSASHRWMLLVVCFVIGGVLGWAVSFLWPSPYRASVDLYVGLDIYYLPSDLYTAWVAEEQEPYRNVDDFKNWQMSQLNAVVDGDDILSETLVRLIEADPYWGQYGIEELRAMLQVSWRNVGRWHFTAEADTPGRARLLVETWEDVIFQEISQALEHAENVKALDTQLGAVSDLQAEMMVRQVSLTQLESALIAWQEDLRAASETDSPTTLQRWYLLTLVSRAADWNPDWLLLVDDIPAEGASRGDYLTWVEKVLVSVQVELADLPDQIEAIEAHYRDLMTQYVAEGDASRALVANLRIERISESAPKVEQMRPTGVSTLLGSILGVLVWLVWVFAKINSAVG
jgi:hypothetical protein